MHASFTTRRRFLFSLAAFTALPEFSWSAESARYTAAIIGHTGAGDYGHGFDTIFEGIENVSVEAIADANESALEKAALRARAKRKYTDLP